MNTLLYGCVLAIVLQHTLTNYRNNQPVNSHPKHKHFQRNQRRVENCTYEIVDTSYFIVYRRLKEIEKIPNKGVMWVDRYYFSRTENDALYELSIDNLKKAFPLNHRFHYALDQYFHADWDLMAYDGYLKVYKLKHIFAQSNQ